MKIFIIFLDLLKLWEEYIKERKQLDRIYLLTMKIYIQKYKIIYGINEKVEGFLDLKKKRLKLRNIKKKSWIHLFKHFQNK